MITSSRKFVFSMFFLFASLHVVAKSLGEAELQYVHGYSSKEATRLLSQGKIFRKAIYNNRVVEILSKVKSITEIGSGSGTNIVYQLKEFPSIDRYNAIDIGQEKYAVDILRVVSSKKLTLIQGNAQDFLGLRSLNGQSISVHKNSQDVVWGTWVLEHIPDPILALNNARYILKPNGYLIFTECSWATAFLKTSSDSKYSIQLVKKFQYFKNLIEKKQRSVGGSPRYGSDQLTKDFSKIRQVGDQLKINLIDMSPGESASVWKSDISGKKAAIEFIFAVFEGFFEGPELSKVEQLKNEIIEQVVKSPEKFKMVIKVFQAILQKASTNPSLKQQK